MIASLLLLYFGSLVLGQEYEGCFKSSPQDPDLSSHVLDRASKPAECIKVCRTRYFMFAGLMNGQQCYCGSHFGRNGPSSACTVPCLMDADNFCGALEAISIYSTGQKGPSPPRRIQINHLARDADSLRVTWEPPDIPNGNITSYTLKGIPLDTHASTILAPVESQVQGGASNSTILLGLQPGTKYNVSITANNAQGSSDPIYGSDWTPIAPPDRPVTPQIIKQESNTVTVLLSEATSDNGPISAYQLIVVLPGVIAPMGGNISYTNYERSIEQGLGYYITGEFDAQEFHKYRRFTIGDGKMIGGYYNAPLKVETPRIGLVAVSRFQRLVFYGYSDLTNRVKQSERTGNNAIHDTIILLSVAIAVIGILLSLSIFVYFMLRERYEKFRMRKLPEQQELTLQGPVYEVDNIGYIPDDVPERVNHYQELKTKVWTMPRECLTIEDTLLRRGRFGTVHKGTVVKDNITHQVAVHTIADRVLRASEKRNMLRELDLCIKAGTTRYLAGLIGTCETPETLHVALELPPRTLKSRLVAARTGNENFPTNQMLPIGAAVASALQHLENYNIVHTHLCARSIGITNEWTPKLMGHGIAKYALEDIKYARWTAIECFGNKKKHQPGVVWAFGVLLWEMLSMGGTPYSNLGIDSQVEEALQQGIRLPQLQDTPDPIYQVMLSCWSVEAQERPTFHELIRLDTLTICPISSITEPYIPELELNQVH